LTSGRSISLSSQGKKLTLSLEIDPRDAQVWWIGINASNP
jgi:hypothetical protein